MADNKKDKEVEGIRYVSVPVGDNVDDATVEEAIRSLAAPVAGPVGNFADLQRGEVSPPPVDPVAKAIEDAVDASKTGKPSSVGDAHTGAAIPGGTYNPPSPK